MENSTTIHSTWSLQSHIQTVVPNDSVPVGCIELAIHDMEFLPWDNPENIFSKEVEKIMRRIDENMLAVFFLIGVPANIINMAVFYKQGLKDRVNLCLFALSLADALHITVAMVTYSEQLYLQFVRNEVYGPIRTFVANNNLAGFFGFQWVSQVLSAIIATERCLCVCTPLKAQTLLQTRTMAVVIICVEFLVVGFFFLVSVKYRVGCVYDPLSGAVSNQLVVGEFYNDHKDFINNLDSFAFGIGIPGTVIVVVIATTTITSIKLHQIVTWRSGTSSSISAAEITLTKMLIGNSLLFLTCITPSSLFRVCCLFFPELNVGRRNHNFYLTILWVLEILSYSNATFNFFVYYTMGSRYRETFRTLFHRKVKSDSMKGISNTTVSKT